MVSMSTFSVLPVLACHTWIEEKYERKKRKGENPPAKRSMMEGGRGRVIESGMVVTGIVVLGSWSRVVLGSRC